MVLVADYVMQYLLRLPTNSSDVTVGYVETIAVCSTISADLTLVAAVLLIRVVRQITECLLIPSVASNVSLGGRPRSVAANSLCYPSVHYGSRAVSGINHRPCGWP
ncbi:hypothetical protein BS329_35455 [Amycolatopsis coloradensis]|uniref:Uncharacterized protein n=2 Tax=Amycolatopsis coloradensis TaxID=76021 RepID=A0A1R0KH95_9PSEU|nr:hypothetical protein BS329_35455 [Amycolatopsis coloradensis]